MNLIQHSIRVIREGQDSGGAYIACPSFAPYQYCWLRDGSFIAYAMDVAGEYDSAGAFFEWVHRAISLNAEGIRRLIERYDSGSFIEQSEFPPARYRLDGTADTGDWPNFQLDGYGTWLWALAEHIGFTHDKTLIDTYRESIALGVEYLKRFWNHENYDCWEENGDKVHTSTLGCIYGGLKGINRYLKDGAVSELMDTVRLFIASACIHSGHLVKYIGSDQVDASLLWLCVPFCVFGPLSSVMKKTVKKIEETLLHDGGVHRYAGDTYYGGGEWPLLSVWLGWYCLARGDDAAARRQIEWAGAQADERGLMPEQTLDHVNNPQKIEKWVNQWGEVAKPLLWSHAMYIILGSRIDKQAAIQ